MAVAPNIAWTEVSCPGFYQWGGSPLQQGEPASPINVPVGSRVVFAVMVSGSATPFTITGDLAANDVIVTSVSDTSQLAVGQTIQCADIPPGGATYPPIIIEVYNGFSQFLWANGVFYPEGDGWIHNRTSATDTVGSTFVVSDVAPAGSLAASVSPSTGVTLQDMGFDSTSDVSHIGEATVISNLVGQGEGSWYAVFADAGTFVASTIFTTADPLFDDVTVSPSLTIVVS